MSLPDDFDFETAREYGVIEYDGKPARFATLLEDGNVCLIMRRDAGFEDTVVTPNCANIELAKPKRRECWVRYFPGDGGPWGCSSAQEGAVHMREVLPSDVGEDVLQERIDRALEYVREDLPWSTEMAKILRGLS